MTIQQTERAREDLLPCPHGKLARIINIGGQCPFSIYLGPDHRCLQRGIGWFTHRREAISAWNELVRATPQPPSEEVVEAVARAIENARQGKARRRLVWMRPS